MLSLFTKKKNNELLLEDPRPSFIPYACHYDPNTILTKNGELVQTIKIVGYSYETLGGSNVGLRELIRSVLAQEITSPQFAIYFHTVRKKQSLDTKPSYPCFFAQKLHNEWVQKNSWDNKYVNELYITIVHAGADFINSSLLSLTKYMFGSKIYRDHDDYLQQAFIRLDKVMLNILDRLSICGAIRLGIREDSSLGYVSDLVKFFSKIVQLEESEFPISNVDLSKEMTDYKIAFGNDTFEIKKNEDKSFGAILSIKAYPELDSSILDDFLQLPQEMIVTQTINFTDKSSCAKHFHYQDYVLGVSGDVDFKAIIGTDKFFDSSKNSPVDFCESQITVMIIEESPELVNSMIVNAANMLLSIGIPVVREDVNLENCFWSQLPGNFAYIARKRPLAAVNMAGLASLHNFPVGSLTSKWGEAITLLKTILGTPYFFNFHVENNGHTAIVGSQSAGKVTMLNFLLSESLKLNPNIFFFDVSRDSELFIKAIGGKYLIFRDKPVADALHLNPLLLDDNPANRKFLCNWFLYILDKYIDQSDIEDYQKLANNAVNVLYTLPKEKRMLRNAELLFNLEGYEDLNKKIIVRLSKWFGPGKYAHIFDNPTDDLDYRNMVLAIDVQELYDTELWFNLPVLYYLFHFFKMRYQGLPSILAVSGGNRIFNNLYFENNLSSILDELSALNSIVVTACSFSSQCNSWSEEIGNILNDKMATKIFLPDDSSYDNIKRIFKLSPQESLYLEALDPEKRQFIVKQLQIAIIAELNLKGLTTSLTILSCEDEVEKQKILDTIQTLGDANSTWVQQLYKT